VESKGKQIAQANRQRGRTMMAEAVATESDEV
jgi:hypothetical protein